MKYRFTPAAQRALDTAAGWTSRRGLDELETPALLLGLLAESECRAAIMLAGRGVDAAAVRRRWSELRPREPLPGGTAPASRQFSADVELTLQVACERLADYPSPLELATEHLLLGLVAADHEVSLWLRDRGLEAKRLEDEIHVLYGHRPGPLPMEAGDKSAEAPEHSHFPWDRPGVKGDREADLREAEDHPHPDPLPEGEGTGVASLPEGEESGPVPFPEGEENRPVFLPTGERIGVLRVVDAAANRAREGLRAVEDYARFVLDDGHLTGRCKQLRHDLAAALGRFSPEHRLAARETQADVGTVLATPSEGHREDTTGVLTANFTRVQEALRSLEEFGKLLDPGLAAELKQLRYRAYTLHRAVEITRTSLHRLDRARLYVLIDARSSPEEFERLARSLLETGVHVIQLRDKTLDDRRLLERARLLRELTRGTDTLFIMNDRPDLAVLSRADGVHVGQKDLSVKDARTIVGPDTLIGVSTHTLDQARQAVLDGANYLGVGPVFPSCTKHFDEFPGVGLLQAVAAEISLPAFAIGGITRENLPEVLTTGFSRVAVAGAITLASEPSAEAREILAALGE